MQLDLLALLAGLLLGAVATWLFFRGRLSTETALQQRIDELSEELRERRTEAREAIDALREENGRLQTAYTREKTELEGECARLTEKLNTQQKDIEKLQDQFKDSFENLANDILEKKTKRFTEQNKTNLDELLKPLGKKLEQFEKEVRETNEKAIKRHSSLGEQLRQLTELNQEMSKEARSLTRALKGEQQKQGTWGEMLLEKILEASGLRKGREYTVQEHLSGANGSGRPDVVVKLPDDRAIIVDSKVSITAYTNYCQADTEEARAEALRAHVQSVRNHVRGLHGKAYHDLLDDGSPDFTLLFIPVEPAFALVLQHDDSLYEDAFRRNIILVSPTTLLATLRTIENIWRYEYQTQNAREIAERGGQLYDKFVLFAEALEEVGNRLEQARDSYDTAWNRLRTGRGNLVRQAEMLRDLGAQGSKQLPASLSDGLDAVADSDRAN